MASDKRMMPAPSIASRKRGFGIVGGHARAHLDHIDAAARLEWPAVEAGTGDHDAVMVFEVGGGFRRTAPLQIRRRRADDALRSAILLLDKRPLRHMAGAHGDIGLLLDQIDQPVGDG